MRVKGDRASLLLMYRRRLIRKKYLWKAFRRRNELKLVSDNTNAIGRNDIVCFSTVRNERVRLPFFLEHYRKLGVRHFLIIDNSSTDGTSAFLLKQPDVSVWYTDESYRASRFGMDWQNWLLRKYASGRWTVVADADELLIYPDWENRDLRALASWLDQRGHIAFSALMLELYPKGPIDKQTYRPADDPTELLRWFDAYGYWIQRQPKLDALWLQGGPRARVFFSDSPHRSPTLNKTPFIKWNNSYAFVNSTHSALPSYLNHGWMAGMTGALLHTKFLPEAPERARVEQQQQQHFWRGTEYRDYYEAMTKGPDFWFPDATCYHGWEQLVQLGLMQSGNWD